MNSEIELKEIKLAPGVYNLVHDVQGCLLEGKEIDGEVLNVLRTFDDSYDLKEDIANRGFDVVLREMQETLNEFDWDRAQVAVEAGLRKAQTLNPAVPLKAFPIVFLFFPSFEDAKSLHGQGCGININSWKGQGLTPEEIMKKIESFVAHEATHVFLKQLRVQPSTKWSSLENFICDFLWEEGLTTYMESDHYPHHFEFIDDAEFWIKVINEWINLEEDDKKFELFQECILRPSTQHWLNYFGMRVERLLPKTDDIDKKFIFLITKMNGVAYHIGQYIWANQLKKGFDLTELVMQGSTGMKKWIKEMIN